MTSTRDSKRSFPTKRYPYPEYMYVNEIIQNWLKEPPKRIFPISTGESKLAYRMTLGSLYYEMEIKKAEAKESETEIGRQSAIFLKTKHPELWRKWVIIKKETNTHLDYVARLWKDHILDPVDKILSQLTEEFPQLVKYKNVHDKGDVYVEDNIKEGVYLEMQHYAALGDRLDFFKIPRDGNKVGNGYTFVISSNTQLLERFIDSINKIINKEKVLDQFRYAEVRKSDVEAKVYQFKKDLIMIKGKSTS